MPPKLKINYGTPAEQEARRERLEEAAFNARMAALAKREAKLRRELALKEAEERIAELEARLRPAPAAVKPKGKAPVVREEKEREEKEEEPQLRSIPVVLTNRSVSSIKTAQGDLRNVQFDANGSVLSSNGIPQMAQSIHTTIVNERLEGINLQVRFENEDGAPRELPPMAGNITVERLITELRAFLTHKIAVDSEGEWALSRVSVRGLRRN